MHLLIKILICLISLPAITACHADWNPLNKTSRLEQIKKSGVLTVLTRYSPSTYYQGAKGYTGLEYDLVMLFARQLGVKVRFVVPDNFDTILTEIASGAADLAAAGLTVTEKRKQQMRFAPPYHEVTEQLIYHSRSRRPKNITDLNDGILEVVHGTSHIDTLKKLRKKNPMLQWNVNKALDTQGLLYLANSGLIDYTIADSNQISLIRRFYPKLNIAFDISKPKPLAWALPKSGDLSLYNEVIRFFKKIKHDNTLRELIERHYGHASNLDYLGLCKFRQHKEIRLPNYQKLFEKAAQKYQLDWRLLAAIAYQESHWLENAISPTGVKGLMMLTKGTAQYLGIKDRADPQQSIAGGALYFKQRIKKIPSRIKEPDRIWMALAAYNVGYGHLEDARVLTQKLGGNPDKWLDVKKTLPLLSQKKWYTRTKHGYARGSEPVRYVENVRSYYDLLVWLTEEDSIGRKVMELQPSSPANNNALDITTPAI